MVDKTKVHKMLIANREEIIRKDKQDTPITEIAWEYGVSFTTIYSLLRKWGKKRDYKRKYFKLPKDQKTEKEKKLIAFKKTLSPELLAKIKENTRINNQFIKSYKTIKTVHNEFLVQEILRKSEAI